MIFVSEKKWSFMRDMKNNNRKKHDFAKFWKYSL
jgi:hypothetical protein